MRDTGPHRLQKRDVGDSPEEPVLGGRPGRRGMGAPGGGSLRNAVLGGLKTQQGKQGWLAPSRRSGGPASAHGCHGDGRAGGGGCAEKRSLISLAAAPGPPAALAAALVWLLPPPWRAEAWGPLARAPWPARRARDCAPPPRTDCRAVPCARRSRGRAAGRALSGCSSRSTTFCCP